MRIVIAKDREELHAALDFMLDKIAENPNEPVGDAVIDYLDSYLRKFAKRHAAYALTEDLKRADRSRR